MDAAGSRGAISLLDPGWSDGFQVMHIFKLLASAWRAGLAS